MNSEKLQFGPMKWGLGIAAGIILVFGNANFGLIGSIAICFIVALVAAAGLGFLWLILDVLGFWNDDLIAPAYVVIAIGIALAVVTGPRLVVTGTTSTTSSSDDCREYGRYGIEVCH